MISELSHPIYGGGPQKQRSLQLLALRVNQKILKCSVDPGRGSLQVSVARVTSESSVAQRIPEEEASGVYRASKWKDPQLVSRAQRRFISSFDSVSVSKDPELLKRLQKTRIASSGLTF